MDRKQLVSYVFLLHFPKPPVGYEYTKCLVHAFDKSNCTDSPTTLQNIVIKKGWFQDTLPRAKSEIGKVAILRLDGDWYESTKCCLDNLYENVSPGGYVIIDDYGYWEGCRQALDEFLHARKIGIELREIDHDGRYFQNPGI